MAIIGSGLLKPYPAENKSLFANLYERGGAVVSPFSLLAEPVPGNFPARNRVIAGLSMGCIVLQAAARSGALITAHYALEQGREVFAVPGPIDDVLSAGCHALIAEGAHLVTCAEDVSQVLGKPDVPLDTKRIEPLLKDKPSIVPPELVAIMDLCQKPISFDELLEKANVAPDQLYEQLFALQLRGKVEQNFMGLWQWA